MPASLQAAAWLAAVLPAAAIAQPAPKAAGKAETKAEAKPQTKPEPKDSAPTRTSAEAIEKAKEALAAGKVEDAMGFLQEAGRKNPLLPPARLLLARMFLGAGAEQARNARMLLEQAAAENPDHPDVYLTLASVA